MFLGVYIFVILSIPVGTYLVSQYQTTQSHAQEQKSTKKTVKVTPKPTISPARELLDSSKKALDSSPATSPSSSEVTTSFGPTLSLKVTLEGRPESNQATKLFIGIADGTLTTNPKFLLSFTVDLPTSGEFNSLSLAGLNSGSTYTAILKGSAQIATASAFTMSPNITNLNSGEVVNLLSGDLNEDNVINSTDYSIAQKAMGGRVSSSNWNENADLNKDEVINAFDLAIITKNIGQVGATGAWTSPVPKTATAAAGLSTPAVGSPAEESGGYWLWIPK